MELVVRGCVADVDELERCTKCGSQLFPNTDFCTVCGAPIHTRPMRVAPAKKKPWFYVVTTFVIMLAFIGVVFDASRSTRTVTQTYTSTSVAARFVTTSTSVATRFMTTSTSVATRFVTTGAALARTGEERVKTVQTFTASTDKVLVEITFIGVRYIDRIGNYTADEGHKFSVPDVTVKNVED